MVSFYELSSALVTVVVYSLFSGKAAELLQLPDALNLLWLAILGLVCTSYAYTASVQVMRSLSAYMINLTINMEPIYGILLGVAIFGESEMMTPGFYVGAVIILSSVFLYPVLRKRLERKLIE